MTTPGSDPYADLAKYFNRPVSETAQGTGPNTTDVAQHILMNAKLGRQKQQKSTKFESPNKDDPSTMSRIFDLLSRPNYAVAETVSQATEDGFQLSDLSGLWEGFSGQKKTTFHDVLGEQGMEQGPGRAAAGFGLDVLLDPTTYLGFGIGKNLAKKSRIGLGPQDKKTNLGRPESSFPKSEQMLRRGSPVDPQSYNLPESAGAFSGSGSISKALTNRAAQSTPSQSINVRSLRSAVDEPKRAGTATSTTPDLFGSRINIPENIRRNVEEVEPPEPRAVSEVQRMDIPRERSIEQTSMRFPGFSVRDARRQSKVEASDYIDRLKYGDPNAKFDLENPPSPPKNIKKWHTRSGDFIAREIDPPKSKADINKKHPETLNAEQQVKLWDRAEDSARKRVSKTYRNRKGNLQKRPEKIIEREVLTNAAKIHREAEKSLMERGFTPRSTTGENVKLSDVVSDMRENNIPITRESIQDFARKPREGSKIYNSLNRLRARSAVGEAPKVGQIVDDTVGAAQESKGIRPFTDSEQSQIDKLMKDYATAKAKTEGISPAGIQSTQKLTQQGLQANKPAAQIALENRKKDLQEVLESGKSKPELVSTTTRNLEKDLGKLPEYAVHNNKGVEFFMGRVSTWWGQETLRPYSLNMLASARNVAEQRGRIMRDLFKGHTDNEISEAFGLAQGFGTASTSATEQLGQRIRQMMDNVASLPVGKSTITRSGVNMNYLNKWMRHYKSGFEFTDSAKVLGLDGFEQDFSNGADWVQSWKTANPTDPKMFMFKMQEAVQMATREKAMFDELAARFGSSKKGKEFTSKIPDHPYLANYYFPDDIAKEIPRVVRDWSPTKKISSDSDAMELYDRVLSMWKAGVTIYRPGHHIRNMVGDVYLGMLDGVNSVVPYKRAMKVQRLTKDKYKDLESMDRMIAMGAAPKSQATPDPKDVLFKNKGGESFTVDEIRAAADARGLLETARTAEDIIDLGETGVSKPSVRRPFGGRAQKVARGTAELQSHNARLAHFIDKVAKSSGKNKERIFEDASRRTRKFHPSGVDLTDFERTTMRRIIPFYSWLRKSSPLLVEGMAMNPGASVLPAKAAEAMQEATGVEGQSRLNPFPVDQMFPDWIKAQGIGPIASPDSWLSQFAKNTPPGYVMAGMGLNPSADLAAQTERPGRSALSALTPALKVPYEIASGRESFTGARIRGDEARPGSFSEYVGEQIPIVGDVQRIAGVTPTGEQTKESIEQGGIDVEGLVNAMTAAGIRGTGPYQDQAQYEWMNKNQAAQQFNQMQQLAELRDKVQGGQ